MPDRAIPDPNQIVPTRAVELGGEEVGSTPTPAQPFSSFMQAPAKPSAQAPTQISPFSLMQGAPPLAGTPSVDTLLGQVSSASMTSADIQNQLGTPNLKLKASTKYLLKNKLSEANDQLRSLGAKLGAKPPATATAPAVPTGPFAKFIGYLTEGQQMMESAKDHLQTMKQDGSAISPADYLLVQLKINKAQQLLEFSSVLLSSAVSDIKQFMQIQF